MIPEVNDAYEKMFAEEAQPSMRDGILKAHRNFLRDAVYFLYENNRVADAAKWYKLLGEKYPDKIILDGDMNSFPRNLTLDEYAVARVQSELGDTSQERTTGVIEGLLVRSYYEIAIGQDDRYAGFKLLARKVYDKYQKKISSNNSNIQRTSLPSFDVLNRSVLSKLLDPKDGMPFAMRAAIRTQVGMPAETNAPPVITATNAIPVTSTNTAGNAPTNAAAQ